MPGRNDSRGKTRAKRPDAIVNIPLSVGKCSTCRIGRFGRLILQSFDNLETNVGLPNGNY